jgi:prepilin-type N-terminal cleavage/methylation domain-containing protein
MRTKNQKGFTLMELMVVIVIVAILAAVTVPLYINYVKDAQRTEAKGAIGAVITAEQTYLQAHPVDGYTAVITDLNVDLSDLAHNWQPPTLTVIDPQNSFKVRFDGKPGAPTENLWVEVTYYRDKAATWDEN